MKIYGIIYAWYRKVSFHLQLLTIPICETVRFALRFCPFRVLKRAVLQRDSDYFTSHWISKRYSHKTRARQTQSQTSHTQVQRYALLSPTYCPQRQTHALKATDERATRHTPQMEHYANWRGWRASTCQRPDWPDKTNRNKSGRFLS